MNQAIIFTTAEEKEIFYKFLKLATEATRVGFISDVEFLKILLETYETIHGNNN